MYLLTIPYMYTMYCHSTSSTSTPSYPLPGGLTSYFCVLKIWVLGGTGVWTQGFLGVRQALCHWPTSQPTKKSGFYTEGRTGVEVCRWEPIAWRTCQAQVTREDIKDERGNADVTTKSSKMERTTMLKMEPLSRCQALTKRQVSRHCWNHTIRLLGFQPWLWNSFIWCDNKLVNYFKDF